MLGHYAYNPHLWFTVAPAGLSLLLAWHAWGQRRVSGAVSLFFGLLISVAIELSATLVLAATDAATKIFWTEFENLWVLPAIVAALCFLLEYAGLSQFLTRRTIVLLAVPALLYVPLILTNGIHHAVWTGFSVAHYVHPVRGWAGWAFAVYGYTVAFLSSGIVVWLFVRFPRLRLAAAVLFCGQMVSRITFLVQERGWNLNAAVDPAALGVAFTLTMYAIALFCLDMFSLLPVARGTMIEQMNDGVMVLDGRQRIVDVNPAATRILGLPSGATSRKDGARIFLEVCGRIDPHDGSPQGPFRICVGKGSLTRSYEVSRSALEDRKGYRLGYLIVLHDVTEQERAQEQLLEQQRALATLRERDRVGRELHDSLGQVLGFVKMQAGAAQRMLQKGRTAQADLYLRQLVAVVREAHADVRNYIVGARIGVGSDAHFLAALENYLGHLHRDYGTHAELEVSPEWADAGLVPTVRVQLFSIIQEALVNVRKHAKTSDVHISLRFAGGSAEAIVRDNGSGFDPGLETPKNGKRFGLHFMQERAREVGGNVTIESAPGAGTQVIIRVPAERSSDESPVG